MQEMQEIDCFISILSALSVQRNTRRRLVSEVISRDPELAVTELQRAINCLLESKIIIAQFGKLHISHKYLDEVATIIDPKTNPELSHGYLQDLYLRENDISKARPTKWVEFFLSTVSILQIIPYVCGLIGISNEDELIVIVMLLIFAWLLVFNRTYFNKHPILIPLDVQQKIHSEYDAEAYIKNSSPQIERGRKLIKLAKLEDNDKVLDVGCGDGRTTLSLFRSNESVQKIVGVDFSKGQIKEAKKLASHPENVKFKKVTEFLYGDFLELRLQGGG
jgi:hypothetical protein